MVHIQEISKSLCSYMFVVCHSVFYMSDPLSGVFVVSILHVCCFYLPALYAKKACYSKFFKLIDKECNCM